MQTSNTNLHVYNNGQELLNTWAFQSVPFAKLALGFRLYPVRSARAQARWRFVIATCQDP